MPFTGVQIGSPSNTTRLAGRVLAKILGGSFCSRTSAGLVVSCRRLRTIVSSGTRLMPRPASVALIRSSILAACAVSSAGNRDDRSLGSVNAAVRVARSASVDKCHLDRAQHRLRGALRGDGERDTGVERLLLRPGNHLRLVHGGAAAVTDDPYGARRRQAQRTQWPELERVRGLRAARTLRWARCRPWRAMPAGMRATSWRHAA